MELTGIHSLSVNYIPDHLTIAEQAWSAEIEGETLPKRRLLLGFNLINGAPDRVQCSFHGVDS